MKEIIGLRKKNSLSLIIIAGRNITINTSNRDFNIIEISFVNPILEKYIVLAAMVAIKKINIPAIFQ